MGLGERLKDIYYAGEEKWYGFWDKVDEHIPVYKVIDPIDSVIPSFALFLIIIFVLLLVSGYFLFGMFAGQGATLRVSVVSDNVDKTPISGAVVNIEGISGDFNTDDFGLTPQIPVAFNSTYNVTATKGTKTQTSSVVIDELQKTLEIAIPGAVGFEGTKSIVFRTENGDIATGQMTLTFSCSTNATPPEAQTINGGSTTVTYSEDDCGTLLGQMDSPKYNSETFSITSNDISKIVPVTLKVPLDTARVTVNLKYNGSLISEPVTVQAFDTTDPVAVDSAQAVNGQAVFAALPVGNYKFKTRMEQGYRAAESVTVSVATGKTNSADIIMQRSLLGIINVTVKSGSILLDGAYVTLQKKVGDSTQEINNVDTNSTGQAQFEISDDASYRIVANLDGYCEAAQDANIGDSIVIQMTAFNSSCGNPLTVRVVDQDNKPVAFAKVVLFNDKGDTEDKMPLAPLMTDLNGQATWGSVRNTVSGETFKAFAFKAKYSGWSDTRAFSSSTSDQPFNITLQIPLGTVNVNVLDVDANPLQFAEVQLFDDYVQPGDTQTPITSSKIIEDQNGVISFQVKADKVVYAVVKNDGYETYTTMPLQVVPDGEINFDVTLTKPPVDQLQVMPLGFFKDGQTVIKVEKGQEYMALFEITAPKNYDELGFFVRAGNEDISKTELDPVFIKEIIAPGNKFIRTGSTFNPKTGYSIDSQYMGLDESKWAEVRWAGDSYNPGKIIVGVMVKIRDTAQDEERLDFGFRAWGVTNGSYERDPVDSEIGTAQELYNKKQELYAATKDEFISVGTETICESPTQEKSFCITSSVTDPDGFTQSFTDSFDAKNSTPYTVSVKVLNNSLISFDNARLMLENPEENIYLGSYTILSPTYQTINGDVNGYKTDWIDTPHFIKNSSIDIPDLNIQPQKTGTGTIDLRIRELNEIAFEKAFSVNIISSKQMKVRFMQGSDFVDDMPTLVSGKEQNITVKVTDQQSGLEINQAVVKIYDRFGTELLEKQTNKLGAVTLLLPAAFPGEKLTLQIEKPEYETLVKDFNIAEDVVAVTPTTLTFTVNPQSKPTDMKTVRIDNKTGLDLTIESIQLTGKLKGLLDESKIESWFDTFKGTTISSQDYTEIDFKVISATTIPEASDLDGTFTVTVSAQGKEWSIDIPAKIRVGLGQDVSDLSCLQISKTSWDDVTRGNQVQLGLEIRNNCTVTNDQGEAVPITLTNLGASISSQTGIAGTFLAQNRTAQVELGTSFPRIFQQTFAQGDKVPVTLSFTPAAGSSGVATGSIIFEAQNKSNSTPQKITAELKFNIDYENIGDCLVIGSDLVDIKSPGDGSFSINNNCKFKSDVQIDKGDLQGAIADTAFSLDAGATKSVKISTSTGQNPGMYNLLIYAREQGTTLELVDNVKVLVEDDQSCFKLTRYEFDVYDSPFNDFDGVDRGYLRNECVQKTVAANVAGVIPYDSSRLWSSALVGAIMGGIGGYVKNGKWWTDNQNVPQAAKETKDKVELTEKEKGSEIVTKPGSPTSWWQKFIVDPFKKAKDAIVNFFKPKAAAASKPGAPAQKPAPPSKNPPASGGIPPASAANAADCINKSFVKKTFTYSDLTASGSGSDQCAQICSEKYMQPSGASYENPAQPTACDGYNLSCKTSCYDQIDARIAEIDKLNKEIQSATNEFSSKLSGSLDGIQKNQDSTTWAATQQKADAQQISTQGINDVGNGVFTQDVTDLVVEHNSLVNEFNNNIDTWNQKMDSLSKLDISDPSDIPKVIASVDLSELFADSKRAKAATIDPAETQNIINAGLPSTANSTPDLNNFSFSTDSNQAGPFGLGNPFDFLNPPTSNVSKNTTQNASSSGTGNFLLGSAPNVGSFLLDLLPSTATSAYPSAYPAAPTNQGLGGMDAIIKLGLPFIAGNFAKDGAGGALIGAAANFFIEWSQGHDTEVNDNYSFTVPLVQIRPITNNSATTGIDLNSPQGIKMKIGDTTYDFDNYYGVASATTQPVTATSPLQPNSYTGNVLINPQALSATMGMVEMRELEFTNPGGIANQELPKTTRSVHQPFAAILTVRGDENVYNSQYKYNDIKTAESKAGNFKSSSGSGGIFSFVTDLFKPQGITEHRALMTTNDLTISQVREYEKKFHILFDSYEYVDCGPTTFPCQTKAIPNCSLDGKDGVTGAEGVPKVKLLWNWNNIGIQECDSQNNPNYNYCDATQFTISTMKKLLAIERFMKQTNLTQCPSTTDFLGTKTQELEANALDVGITSVTTTARDGGAQIDALVESTNNLPMSATVAFNLSRTDGTSVPNACPAQTTTFTSSQKFTCLVDSNKVGTGVFNVNVIMTPQLCQGCDNGDATNDTIKTQLVIGAGGSAQACQEYVTNRDYFEKVLSANDALDSDGKKILTYLSFKTDLVRDGFSQDFKKDFDDFVNQVAGAETDYRDLGIRDLFMSDKFKVVWPSAPDAWSAGKYDVTIKIKFKDNSWNWDNNNIDSVIVQLDPQGPPDDYSPIYNLAFDGVVGLTSENGRQGYGAGYVSPQDQPSAEEPFVITTAEGVNVVAQPKASSNALTSVEVSVIKGTQAFYQLNTLGTRGDVLTIGGTPDAVKFQLVPSIAVPLILHVDRKTSTDAFAFYIAQVNGQPQDTGSSFLSWTGIGQGCVDFKGKPMSGYSGDLDAKANTQFTGNTGYGISWPMADLAGRTSLYSSLFAPQDSATVLMMTNSKDAASFEVEGTGGKTMTTQQITVSTANNDRITSLQDVLDKVKSGDICVKGGEYFWNIKGLADGSPLKAVIDQADTQHLTKEQIVAGQQPTCIPSR